ncbi:MAG: zinc ribbon domain-containing protein [Fibrobacter sp.]|jgi:uncharacterized membrane protein YvbJ|nr:zinc ribbon domain-containing protein [Fibrobacter sp.]
MSKKTAVCVYCGEQIDATAKACPHCGSDENTGWSENTYLDGIDLVDEDQYEEIREREFCKRTSFPAWQIITGVVLLAIIVIMILSFAW